MRRRPGFHSPGLWVFGDLLSLTPVPRFALGSARGEQPVREKRMRRASGTSQGRRTPGRCCKQRGPGWDKARRAGRPCRLSPEFCAKPGEARGRDHGPPTVWRARAGGERSELAVSEKKQKIMAGEGRLIAPTHDIPEADRRPGVAGVVCIPADALGGSARRVPARVWLLPAAASNGSAAAPVAAAS